MAQKVNRILLFSTAYAPYIGGSELAIENIAKQLDDIEFHIITPRFKRHWKVLEQKDNVYIYRVGNGTRFDKYLLPYLGYKKAKELFADGIAFDCMHAYQASYGGAAALLVKRAHREIPFIVTLQEGKNLEAQSFFIRETRRRILQAADRVTAISVYLKNYAGQNGARGTVHLIPNGVDGSLFLREFGYGELQRVREELDIKVDEKVILSVSRLEPKNGITDLLKAFGRVRELLPETRLRLVLVGDGGLRQELAEQAKVLNIDDLVIFLGQIPYEALPVYFAIGDVFVRPSLSEGLGTAFLEAMAVGIPVVATDVGGIGDYAKHKKNAVLCTPGDIDGISNAIIEILTDEKLRKELRSNAQKTVAGHYTWEHIAEKMRKVYQSV